MKDPAKMTREELYEFLFGKYTKTKLARFKKFHLENPHIWKEFKRRVAQAMRAGVRFYSARVIIEVVRWHFDVETKGNPFKVNNDWSPLYARLFVYNYPRHADFFEFREVQDQDIMSEEERYRLAMGLEYDEVDRTPWTH